MKRPWLAAGLNFILPGLGYLYLQKRTTFGVIILVATISTIVWTITDKAVGQALSSFGNVWGNVATLAFALGFAFDAYQEAKTR